MKPKCTFPDTVTCPLCGKPWIRQNRQIALRNGRQCPTCRAEKKNCVNRRSYLPFAHVKPCYMSEARWRCELRRRLKPDYFACCGDPVR